MENSTSDSLNNILFEDLHDDTNNYSEDCPKVNVMVRQYYYDHLKNSLNDNINFCKKNENIRVSLNIEDVHKYAQQIELKALRACMMTDVYRNEMLKEIRIVRENTQKGMLFLNNPTYSILFEDYINSRKVDATENINMDEEDNTADLLRFSNKTVVTNNFPPHLTKNSNDKFEVPITFLNKILKCVPETVTAIGNGKVIPSMKPAEDDIMEKMENMFGSQDNAIIEVIFGTDIETYDDNARNKSIPVKSNSPELKLSNSCIRTYQKKTINNLSFWNVEEFVQLSIFRQRMYAMSEINPLKYKKIIQRLNHFFGDESDLKTEETPVNLEELKHVCKNRVTHFVISCLTAYYKTHIKSREVFKALSRSLVAVLLQCNPYIDGVVIFKSIQVFFRSRNRIIKDYKDVKYAVHHIENNVSRDSS